MATYDLPLIQTTTVKEIAQKFAAFKLLYGESVMLLQYGNALITSNGHDSELVRIDRTEVISIGKKLMRVRGKFNGVEITVKVKIPSEYKWDYQNMDVLPFLKFMTK